MNLLNKDLSKLVKVRWPNGDVQEFLPSVAFRLVNNGQVTLFEEEEKSKAVAQTAAINRAVQTASQGKAPLRTSGQTR